MSSPNQRAARRRVRLYARALALLVLGVGAASAQGQGGGAGVTTGLDPAGDAVVRRVDAGANGPVDAATRLLPDLLAYRLGGWQPDNPPADLYAGHWAPAGAFFRLDLIFAGRVNPPGTVGLGYPYDPFLYGPNPVFGYVEIDMDGDVNTGGELASPRLRYLGNAARFGGLPSEPRFDGRAATRLADFDNDILTQPWIERSGEEFHLALLGWHIDEVRNASSPNVVGTFGDGDTWLVSGRLFHRAHGYEPFSLACCTGLPGSYEPRITLLWQHDTGLDRTTVSLVYPLTNAASAAMRGEVIASDLDGDASDQNSVVEALDDLVFSVNNASTVAANTPSFVLIAGWATKTPWGHLNPATWRVTAIVGTAYDAPGEDAPFVWTDIAPNVVRGDFSGNGVYDGPDRLLLHDILVYADGRNDWDADGVVDGHVTLFDFGPNFSVFDVNYDGVIDNRDRRTLGVPSDFDNDGDVDLADFAVFLACFNGPTRPAAHVTCSMADFDDDGDVDLADFATFLTCFNGPSRPPACSEPP